MLEIKSIKKDYQTKSLCVNALKGITFTLRDSEFVSILGPSGCGKTTTLNIIGGLDRYTFGDLVIDGVSTKEYKDKDWDRYRNHKVGFVFQSYNLIPHQTVLSNVELALTIANTKKQERRKLALEALEKVGLKGEENKFPSEMSGGQMQRVAIARAIVNKPSIILADEPTGALDSKTSVQVLDILKELSKECLVVMVTHNKELADKYSSRIINLKDGLVVSDSNPCLETYKEKEVKEEKKKVGMPFFTALKLSLSNLRSKLGRTFLTCLAGSIGIIGIALVLSISNGFHSYVSNIERSTLSKYPITIEKSTIDLSSMFQSLMQASSKKSGDRTQAVDNSIIPNYVMVDLVNQITQSEQTNDLESFKAYVLEHIDEIKPYLTGDVKFDYGTKFTVFANRYDNDSNFIVKELEPFNMPSKDYLGNTINIMGYDSTYLEAYMSRMEVWSEITTTIEVLESQYDLLAGSWPTNDYQVLYVVDDLNQVSDFALYSTDMIDCGEEYIKKLFAYLDKNNDYNINPKDEYSFEFTYDDFLAKSYLVVPSSSMFVKDEGDNPYYTRYSKSSTEFADILKNHENGVMEISVVGVIRKKPSSDAASISGTIAYMSGLLDKINTVNLSSSIYQDMYNGTNDKCLYNLLGSLLGDSCKGKTFEEIKSMLPAIYSSITVEYLEEYAKDDVGYVDLASPESISFYPKSFEDKEKIVEFINKYNESVSEDKKISYTDYVKTIMGSVSTIINAITYVLIAFVSISLIVSSIMIAIITYISVLERTKEIGILRAMGASKADVRNIFNAETFLTGLISGILGVAISLLLIIPINIIVGGLTGIANLAYLPVLAGVILVAISFVLCVLSGLIPSKAASKCDPVIALRAD